MITIVNNVLTTYTQRPLPEWLLFFFRRGAVSTPEGNIRLEITRVGEPDPYGCRMVNM